MIDLRQDAVEGDLNASRIESGRLDKGQIESLRERHRLVFRNGSQVPQVRFVSDQHDHNLGVRVFAQLRQPSLSVLKRAVVGDVIHEKRAYGTPIITALGITAAVRERLLLCAAPSTSRCN